MTFAEIARDVCSKIGEEDSDSLAAAIRFAKNRYRIMWNAHDWPETKVRATFSMASGKTGLYLPRGYGEIISIGTRLQPTDNPMPLEYRDYGWIMRNDAGAITNSTDAQPRYYWKSQPRAIPVDNLSQRVQLAVLNPTGDNVQFTIRGTAIVSGDYVDLTESLPVLTPQPQSVFSVNTWLTVDVLSKATGQGNIKVVWPTGEEIMGPAAEDLSFQSIHWFPVSTSSFYLDLEAKLLPPRTLADNGVPTIAHLEDAIMSYCHADMLERQQQYDVAQAKISEAAQFVQGAKNIQRDQANYFIQVTPQIYDDVNLRSGLYRISL